MIAPAVEKSQTRKKTLLILPAKKYKKQKIYEILTSPKMQTKGVVLNSCIDKVCLCFDRLLLLDLSVVQVLHTYTLIQLK